MAVKQRGAWGLDDYLQEAQGFIESGRLDSQEMAYKLEAMESLRKARAAVLAGDPAWPSLVRKGLDNNLTHFRQKRFFSDWLESQPEGVLIALRALWAEGSTPPEERIRAFLAQAPQHHDFRGAGTRLRPISVLLMALGPGYPPFKVKEFIGAYDLLAILALQEVRMKGSNMRMPWGFLINLSSEIRRGRTIDLKGSPSSGCFKDRGARFKDGLMEQRSRS